MIKNATFSDQFVGILLVDAGQESRVSKCIESLNKIQMSELPALATANQSAVDFWAEESYFRPYSVVDGTLMIPVKGLLLRSFPYQIFDWATGYEYIKAAIERGLDDSNVERIALIIDSPGGIASGNSELCNYIRSIRSEKPIESFVFYMACSAAYGIASSTNKIHMAPTAVVGSIGVVQRHLSYAGAMEKSGVEVTYIFAGDTKVDGNPYEKLSKRAYEDMKLQVDTLYGIFVTLVALGRNIPEDDVIATQARTYMGSAAIEIGLADNLGVFEDLISEYSGQILLANGEPTMSTVTPAVEANSAQNLETVKAEAHAAGLKEGAASATSRIKDIFALAEYTGRESLANHLAFNTDLSVEAIKGSLAAAPITAKAETPATEVSPRSDAAAGFDAAMQSTGNPGITASVGGEQLNERESAEQADLAYIKNRKSA